MWWTNGQLFSKWHHFDLLSIIWHTIKTQTLKKRQTQKNMSVYIKSVEENVPIWRRLWRPCRRSRWPWLSPWWPPPEEHGSLAEAAPSAWPLHRMQIHPEEEWVRSVSTARPHRRRQPPHTYAAAEQAAPLCLIVTEAEQRGDMVANRAHVLIEEEHQGDLVANLTMDWGWQWP